MTESKVDEVASTLDGKLRCLQSLLHQMGANAAANAVGEARDALVQKAALIDAAEYMLCDAYRGPDQDNLRAALAACTPAKEEGR